MRLTRATNAYSAGAGTMPPFLAGRDRDVENVRGAADPARRLCAGEASIDLAGRAGSVRRGC